MLAEDHSLFFFPPFAVLWTELRDSGSCAYQANALPLSHTPNPGLFSASNFSISNEEETDD